MPFPAKGDGFLLQCTKCSRLSFLQNLNGKGGRFEKPLNMNIYYYQTLVFKKLFFENHLHTLTKLPFYTGPKDMADPVIIMEISDNRIQDFLLLNRNQFFRPPVMINEVVILIFWHLVYLPLFF